ncbi:hypothetical protein SESBI_34861 [Sesbania bispinosa]|nr:hypothetical protein SESBI_34861 [Sesbania bispinosa]
MTRSQPKFRARRRESRKARASNTNAEAAGSFLAIPEIKRPSESLAMTDTAPKGCLSDQAASTLHLTVSARGALHIFLDRGGGLDLDSESAGFDQASFNSVINLPA